MNFTLVGWLIFLGGSACFLLWCASWYLAYRERKLLFWIFWNVAVGAVAWGSWLFLAVGAPVVWCMWVVSLVVIPLYWLLKGRSVPAPRADYSDLKPLVDEHGVPRIPR